MSLDQWQLLNINKMNNMSEETRKLLIETGLLKENNMSEAIKKLIEDNYLIVSTVSKIIDETPEIFIDRDNNLNEAQWNACERDAVTFFSNGRNLEFSTNIINSRKLQLYGVCQLFNLTPYEI